MQIQTLYNKFLQYPVISTDSRKIEKDSIFFALKGEHFDGNQFATQALHQGAKYAVIDNPSFAENDSYLVVENVLETLQNLARYHRSHFKIPVIAITGSNGKTTTKELITTVLSKKYLVHATAGNLNNHIGVPITVLGISDKTEIAIIEMGANHPGEIDALCKIADPDFGIITNIGKAHLEGFGSYEGVVKTKTELYRYLHQKNGKVFVNSMENYLIDLLNDFSGEIITYGLNKNDFCIGELIPENLFLNFLYYKNSENIKKEIIKTQLYGDYNFSNALTAATLGLFFQVNPEWIKEALESYVPKNQRSQIIHTLKNTIILDAYNANPSSMKTAIENFYRINHENKVMVLGDMLELGEYSEEEHKNILDLIHKLKFKDVYLAGTVFNKVNTSFQTFHDANSLKNELTKMDLNKKLILIKGSRGMQMERLIDVL